MASAIVTSAVVENDNSDNAPDFCRLIDMDADLAGGTGHRSHSCSLADELQLCCHGESEFSRAYTIPIHQVHSHMIAMIQLTAFC